MFLALFLLFFIDFLYVFVILFGFLGVFVYLLLAFFGSRHAYTPSHRGSQPFHDVRLYALPRQRLLQDLPNGVVLASPWRRIIAFCIDAGLACVLLGLGVMPACLLYVAQHRVFELTVWMGVALLWAACAVVCCIAYLFGRDVVGGQSVARRMLGIQVVHEGEATPVGGWPSIARNAVLVTGVIWPIEVFYLFVNPHYRRFGDQWMKTIVIKTEHKPH